MTKTIFKCIMCEGNVYPCIFHTKSNCSILVIPTKCPFGYTKVKWENVSKESETISYDTDGNVIHGSVAKKTKRVEKVQDDDRSLQGWSDVILGRRENDKK